MALWGNNDAVGSGGTVSLDYSTGVVTGTATTFGNVGAAATGDVIRFGNRAGTYYGDAVIVGIASTTQLTIGSTAGLSGVAIAGTEFRVSQLPKYTVLDYSFSAANDADETASTIFVGVSTGFAGVATDIIPVVIPAASGLTPAPIKVGDVMVNDGNNLFVNAIGDTTITLGSTISAGISTNDALTFKRYSAGYDKYAYGVAAIGASVASGTAFETGVGWVGVTTYRDNQGNLRVKKEILVAMSGITTGNTPLYPPA